MNKRFSGLHTISRQPSTKIVTKQVENCRKEIQLKETNYKQKSQHFNFSEKYDDSESILLGHDKMDRANFSLMIDLENKTDMPIPSLQNMPSSSEALQQHKYHKLSTIAEEGSIENVYSGYRSVLQKYQKVLQMKLLLKYNLRLVY